MLAYIEGMLCATYGVNLIGGFVPEWQIDAVKKYAQKLKEEIDHALLTSTEKDNQKDCWSDGLKQQLKVSKTNYVEKVGCYRTKKS